MTTFKRDFTFKNNIIEVVARNVRKYRKMAGITQEQLATDIGGDLRRHLVKKV